MKKGQSLIELIVAMAIGAILIVGGVAALLPVLKISGGLGRIQTAAALGKELLENTRALAESDWHAIHNLSLTSANRYYLIASASPFTVTTGTESVTVATTTYTRYFYLDEVYRNTAGEIDSGGSLDPSTKKITVVYAWASNSSSSMVSYLTRSHDEAFFATDWSRGGNQEGPFTATGTIPAFATSSGIDYTSYPGSIVITGF